MGYRSEVHIAVPKKDEKKLDAIMNKHKLLKGDEPPFTKENYTQKWDKYNDNNELVEESTDYVIYHGVYLKWYDGYKDVDEITSFIEKKPYDCCEEESGRTMVCIGEDNAVHSDVGDYDEVFNVYMNVELQ